MHAASMSIAILCSALWASGLCAAERAVWVPHEYTFQYTGFTTTYSCDGLADKLEHLLILSGAHADAKANPGSCSAGFGRPDKFANAKLHFRTLASADVPGAIGEIKHGHWRAVSVAAQRPMPLQSGDCELVEQFRDQVLKKMFTIRKLEDNTRCVPHQASGSIDLRFEVFVPRVPAPATP